ncbi:prepilin-type N-terminal cleavage/methylation domain-containing protein [Candidatus Saccharibacteria bacterium]|nr:prepilin-type N-terminal cleavage/methylation domain-containing protein [Candidatus Saccharibacteria bacterium]MBH2007729.1 prepilin-type N-terminal cleavage/methylation domain-containing protein [Candidatus Saccharibacteria bacterium]
MRHSSGFTVVELLVVIVVIGILAAVSIVAFTGVRQHATDTSQVAAVGNWEKVLKAYYARYNKLPTITSTSMPPSMFGGTPVDRAVCLGRSYPADGYFGNGECLSIFMGKAGAVDTPFMNQIETMATVNGLNMERIGAEVEEDGVQYSFVTRGAALLADPNDSAATARIFYGIMGKKCEAGDESVLNYDEIDNPTLRGNLCIRHLKLVL